MSIINISSKERNIMSLTWQKKKKDVLPMQRLLLF